MSTAQGFKWLCDRDIQGLRKQRRDGMTLTWGTQTSGSQRDSYPRTELTWKFTTHNFPLCVQPIFHGTAFSAAPLDIQLISPCRDARV